MQIIWFTYLAMLFILPLPFGAVENWSWPIFGSVYACMFLAIKKSNHPVVYPPHIRNIFLALFAIQIWVFTQLITSSSFSPIDTLLSGLKGLGIYFFTICSFYILNSKKRIQSTILAIGISGAFQAFYGSSMVFNGKEYVLFLEKPDYIGAATGTFINRNHLAGYLEISLALCLGLLVSLALDIKITNWRDRLRIWIKYILGSKGLLRALILIMVTGLVMTHSRMGNTAFFSSLAIVSLITITTSKSLPKSIKPFLISVFIIDIIIVGAFFGLGNVAERIHNTSKEYEQRDEISRDTLKMANAQILFGTGAGSFIYSFPKYKNNDHKSESFTNNAHNDYLQFLSEFGLPAFSIFLFITFISTLNSIQAIMKRKHIFNVGIGFGTLVAFISIGLHSIVDFNLQITSNAYMFCLLIILSVVARWSQPGRSNFYSPINQKH